MQPVDSSCIRRAQSLRRTLTGLSCFLGACLWLILVVSVEAGSVSRIYGAASTLPSSIEPYCSSPQICPEFWDYRPTEGVGIIYGNRAFSADTTCRKSTDAGRTFTLCPTNYAVTTVGREVDIPANGAILSLRFEAGAFAGCRFDRSVDGGVNWTTVTIVAGANLECAAPNAQFPGESLRCVGTICLAYVRLSTNGRFDIYRSVNNGDTWALASTGNVPVNCTTPQGIYFDGGVGLATCQRNLSSATESARVSVDSGATWTYIISPAAPTTDYCSIGSRLTGFDTGYAMACYNNGTSLDQLRFLSSNANVLIPTNQPNYGGAYNPFSNPQMIELSTGNVWIFALGSFPAPKAHVLRTVDGGQNLYEIPESVNGTFLADRLYQGREYQGALMITSGLNGGTAFTLLQGN